MDCMLFFAGRKILRRAVILGVLAFSLGVFSPTIIPAVTSPTAKPVYQPLSKPGDKSPIDADHYFIFGFDKQPKIGTTIMRLEVFIHNLIGLPTTRSMNVVGMLNRE